MGAEVSGAGNGPLVQLVNNSGASKSHKGIYQGFNETPERAIFKELQIELVCVKYIILSIGVVTYIYKYTTIIK